MSIASPFSLILNGVTDEADAFLALDTHTHSSITTTVALAKITSGGTDGSLTFTDGILTEVVNPT